MLSKPKNRKVAALLAFAGTVAPIAGFHKFYLGQPLWGVLYVLLSFTPIPRVASALDGALYLVQNSDEFDQNFNAGVSSDTVVSTRSPAIDPDQVNAVADAVRQLDRLRQDGLISEYEFEQKRRQLLDRLA